MEHEISEPSTHQMEVFKVDLENGTRPGVQRLGVFPLSQGSIVVNAFSIQTRAVLIVTTTSGGTKVDRVQFPFDHHEQKVVCSSIRGFGKKASRCDFRPSERIIAFLLAGDEVILYKFNEAFTAMEVIRSIKLSARSSLSLPVTDLVLLDNADFLFDESKAAQSVNIRSQQTSRQTGLFC